MSEDLRQDEPSRDQVVAEILAQFAAAGHSASPPRLRDWLRRYPDLYDVLGPELLALDCHHRRLRGETPVASDYSDLPSGWVQQALDEEQESLSAVRSLHSGVRVNQRPRVDDPTLPEAIAGFQVLDRLGQGGFGEVYLAYDTTLDRLVAIKVPRNLTRQKLDKEWIREARIVARLDHPHIVPVYHVGQTPEHPAFIVSKYIDGCSLAERLRQAPLSLERAVEFVMDVAGALHYAHHAEAGVIHRDIKPANLLLDQHDKIYVADFGLAQREIDLREDGSVAGTPAYMSPEQARGEGHRVDGRSDLFSLAIVLYELLTGVRPFTAPRLGELLEQIKYADPRPPRLLNPAIPAELERICLRALAKRSAERYDTLADFAGDLRQLHASGLLRAETKRPLLRPIDAETPRGALLSTVDAPVAATDPAETADPQPVLVRTKGLRAFDAEDAELFLELLPGQRDREGLPESIRFWKQRIEQTDPHKTFAVGVLKGSSGCGKSSLVKAGLLPRLSDQVVTIYLEASADLTESGLLQRLQRRIPRLRAQTDLAGCLTAVRREWAGLGRRKLLLVIDQFEQWLHAHEGESNPALGEALRQCDGQHLQCLLMVRHDYALGVYRLLQQLEIPLVQGQNSAVVDRFDLPHAERVLTNFGRAMGKLAASGGELDPPQQRFVREAIASLAEQGQVVPVRLALFAEMFRHRTWTPEALIAVGGAEGVGRAFLEETFRSESAPPQYRQHAVGAQRVLAALLPEAGSEIRGHWRSQRDLEVVAGYGNRPREAAELLRILDTDLRLISPVATGNDAGGEVGGEEFRETGEGSAANGSGPQFPSGKNYHLSHDYLVPSLRRWLEDILGGSPEGRARLLLRERSRLWNDRPLDRNLPTLLEHWQIRRRTRMAERSDVEEKMLRRAAVVHGGRVGWMVTALLLVGLGLGWLRHQSRQRDAVALVEKLAVAPAAEWNGVRQRLHEAGLAELAAAPLRSGLAKAEELGATSQIVRLRWGLLAILADGGQVAPLMKSLETVSAGEFMAIRRVLMGRMSPELVESLWRRIDGATLITDPASAQQRFQVTAALAEFAPETDQRWSEEAARVVRHLVSLPPVDLVAWRPQFSSMRKILAPRLVDCLSNPELGDAERSAAADSLADFARDDANLLARSLVAGDARAFSILMTAVHRIRDDVRNELLQSLGSREHDWPDTASDPTWLVIPEELRDEMQGYGGELGERWAICTRLPVQQVTELCEKMRPYGYRPVGVWSWRLRDSLKVHSAVVWWRDGVRWRICGPANAQSLLELDSHLSDGGYSPIIEDLVPAGGEPHGIVIWAGQSRPRGEASFSDPIARLVRDRGSVLEATSSLWCVRQPMAATGSLPSPENIQREQSYHQQRLPRFLETGLTLDSKMGLRFEHSLLLMESDVEIAENGEYQFWSKSAAPIRVRLDGRVIEDDWKYPTSGTHFVDRSIELTAGTHRIEVVVFHRGGPLELEVSLGKPWVAIDGPSFGKATLAGGNYELRQVPIDEWESPAGMFRMLISSGFRPAGFQALETPEGGGAGWGVVCLKPKSSEEHLDRWAIEQSRRLMSLAHLGEPAPLWKALGASPQDTNPSNQDPRLRTELIHSLIDYGLQPATLVERFRAADSAGEHSLRRALLLALGATPVRSSLNELKPLIEQLQLWKVFATDPDPGVHSAAEWLLRRWEFGADIDRWLAEQGRQQPPENGPNPTGGWYVGTEGQTFAILDAQCFQMGSPASETERSTYEWLHTRCLNRRFAIMTTEVTHAQYKRFQSENPGIRRFADLSVVVKTEDSPQVAVDWFSAANYCNWLSQKEGIPVEQWCYEGQGDDIQPKRDWVMLSGYRLPTEAEWEFACRAGSNTSRPHSGSDRWLSEYAWLAKNSGSQTHPVRQLKPNDHGLFDMLGNVIEWCQELSPNPTSEQQSGPVDDEPAPAFDRTQSRPLRGSAFNGTLVSARIAAREVQSPTMIDGNMGLRPVRTIPQASADR